MWKIDTGTEGIGALFKPYQYDLIKYVLNSAEGVTSANAHAALEFRGIKISRASVINYLQKLTKFGIISSKDESAKGGYRSVYSAKLSFEEIIQRITNDLLRCLLTAFPESDYLKYLGKE